MKLPFEIPQTNGATSHRKSELALPCINKVHAPSKLVFFKVQASYAALENITVHSLTTPKSKVCTFTMRDFYATQNTISHLIHICLQINYWWCKLQAKQSWVSHLKVLFLGFFQATSCYKSTDGLDKHLNTCEIKYYYESPRFRIKLT